MPHFVWHLHWTGRPWGATCPQRRFNGEAPLGVSWLVGVQWLFLFPSPRESQKAKGAKMVCLPGTHSKSSHPKFPYTVTRYKSILNTFIYWLVKRNIFFVAHLMCPSQDSIPWLALAWGGPGSYLLWFWEDPNWLAELEQFAMENRSFNMLNT